MDREADRREGKKQISEVDESEKIRLIDIKDFNLSFWVLLINCVLIYGGFFAFTGNANDLMVQMYGFTPDEAGNFITIIYIIAALITPLFGMFTDRFGKRADLMLVSLVLFIISNLLFAYLPEDSSHGLILLPLILSGLFYSTYAAIFWPCVPLIVDKNKVGTAFGVITAFQNANLVVSPLLFGVIHDATPNDRNGYFWAELFIVLQAILGLYSAGFLNIIDQRAGSVLNSKRKPKMSKHSFHM
jgi:nitrate/nitrite transporter NarK